MTEKQIEAAKKLLPPFRDVYTDNEDCTYNTVKWADD